MKLIPWEPDLKTVVDRIDSGDIDLQPNFQRQEIWPTAKKRRLIDTIIRGWSVPPIFLVVVAEGRMEVLDGQQRLAAIRDFIHNEFSVDGNVTPEDESVRALSGLFYKTLPIAFRRLIDQFTLRCFKITDYRPDEPSELFYRLNQPSMLTAGEQRNAFFGPAREQLKHTVSIFEIENGNNKETIGFSNIRLAYDDIIARLLFFIESRTFSIKSTENVISQRFRDRSKFSEDVIDTALRAIHLFSSSRSEVPRARLNKASTLSWLLFFSRFKNHDPSLGFMDYFFSVPSHSLLNSEISAFKLFQDRSSLRVTDTSSVVYRDFCLWYIYTIGFESSPPVGIDTEVIGVIHSTLRKELPLAFETAVASLLNVTRWSELR